MMPVRYTPIDIKQWVFESHERLFSSYSVGRPANWNCDARTRELVSLSVWLNEEMQLLSLDDAGRKAQLYQFNRRSRSEENLYDLAASIMNEVVEGTIDRDRKPHRRWG